MKKSNIIIIGSLILAIILGLWGQSIAYFLHHNFVDILPIYYLTALTIISIILFLSSFILSFLQFKNNKTIEEKTLPLHFVIALISVVTSLWSLFVLIVWWSK